MRKSFILLAFTALFIACTKDKKQAAPSTVTTDFRDKFTGKYYVKVDTFKLIYPPSNPPEYYPGFYHDTITVSYSPGETVRTDSFTLTQSPSITITRSGGQTYTQVAIDEDGYLYRNGPFTGRITEDSINIKKQQTLSVDGTSGSTMTGIRIK